MRTDGVLPGFSSSTRLIARRPTGMLRPLVPRLKPRLRRAAKAHRRDRIDRATRRLLRELRPKGKKLAPEQLLVERGTWGLSQADLARIAELGHDAWLDEQLDPDFDDGGFEEQLASALPSLSMTPWELNQSYENDPFQPVIELMLASVFRAAFSPRQVFERFAVFWSDHFSIDILADHGYLLKPTDDREVVRRHALGSFPDMLRASAHSPSMLEYLTNDSNTVGHPNENYARELMELHTLGVDGPYTEEDVREVARAFTGWTLHNVYDTITRMGTFNFDRFAHDRKKKKVLGTTLAANRGIEDGEDVLDLLAAHPQTASFIAEKMARFFLGYKPKRSVVRKVARKYRATGGNIRAMARVILSPKNLRRSSPKLKRPFHLMVSAIRATGADMRDARFLFEQLEIAGHLPFAWSAPNGYPDDPTYWSGFILPRWNYAAQMPVTEESGIAVDPSLENENVKPKVLVRRLDRRIFNGAMSAKTKKALTDFLEAKPVSKKRVREAVGMALASPEFQLY